MNVRVERDKPAACGVILPCRTGSLVYRSRSNDDKIRLLGHIEERGHLAAPTKAGETRGCILRFDVKETSVVLRAQDTVEKFKQ